MDTNEEFEENMIQDTEQGFDELELVEGHGEYIPRLQRDFIAQQAIYASLDNMINNVPEHFSELANVESLSDMKSQLKEGTELIHKGYNKAYSKIQLLSIKNSRLQAEVNNLRKGRITAGQRFISLNQNVIEDTLRNKEFCEEVGLTNSAIGMLIRLGGCIEFGSGLLISRDTGLPFTSNRSIADYLGDDSSNTGKNLNALIRAGILYHWNRCYIVNEQYINCGYLGAKTLHKRSSILRGTGNRKRPSMVRSTKGGETGLTA